MHSFLLDLLACPACQGELDWAIAERQADRIETARARCQNCNRQFPVLGGIGNFLLTEHLQDDLWEQADSQLSTYLKQNPGVEKRLLHSPIDEMNPADLLYRSLVLEERGDFQQSQLLYEAANARLYTPEYLICHESQMLYLIDQLGSTQDPIFDFASGRGTLVEAMLPHTSRPIVLTDFSPRILRRNRGRFDYFGQSERISLLAFDARHPPLKSGAVKTLTTNLGLANIRHPESLLKELRRVVSGQFLAVTYFFQPDDDANRAAIEELNLSPMLYQERAQLAFTEAGWHLTPQNVCQGRVAPVPTGEILENARVDSLPVEETQLQWTTLFAT